MKISKRLSICLKYTEGFNKLADIGTDHALLPINAVVSGMVSSAQAIDNNFAGSQFAAENSFLIGATGIEEYGNPTAFSLYQNFPNPFNPSTRISWQSPVGSWQTLKVYDVLGNEVATLVDEYIPAGEYEVDFNSNSDEGQNLSSGVYFYQLIIKGPEINSGQGIIQTMKMILMK